MATLHPTLSSSIKLNLSSFIAEFHRIFLRFVFSSPLSFFWDQSITFTLNSCVRLLYLCIRFLLNSIVALLLHFFHLSSSLWAHSFSCSFQVHLEIPFKHLPYSLFQPFLHAVLELFTFTTLFLHLFLFPFQMIHFPIAQLNLFTHRIINLIHSLNYFQFAGEWFTLIVQLLHCWFFTTICEDFL